MVGLACKRCNRENLDFIKYAIERHIIYLYAICGHNWDMPLKLQGNPLAALDC